MSIVTADRPVHGHHKLAAAVFVGALVLGAALILAAELVKPQRYEFHPGSAPTNYVIYDRDTGRAATVDIDSKDPLNALK